METNKNTTPDNLLCITDTRTNGFVFVRRDHLEDLQTGHRGVLQLYTMSGHYLGDDAYISRNHFSIPEAPYTITRPDPEVDESARWRIGDAPTKSMNRIDIPPEAPVEDAVIFEQLRHISNPAFLEVGETITFREAAMRLREVFKNNLMEWGGLIVTLTRYQEEEEEPTRPAQFQEIVRRHTIDWPVPFSFATSTGRKLSAYAIEKIMDGAFALGCEAIWKLNPKLTEIELDVLDDAIRLLTGALEGHLENAQERNENGDVFAEEEANDIAVKLEAIDTLREKLWKKK